MAIAFDKRRRREYVPVCDKEKPEAERTVFVLRQLDVFDRTKIADLRSGGMGPGLMTLEMLRLTLDGWRNYKLADGSEVPFERGAAGLPTDETLRCITDEHAAELVGDSIAWEEVSPKQAGE